MGGDALGIQTKRLTSAEFRATAQQLQEILGKEFARLEVYPPMPEKQSHGDVDFIVLHPVLQDMLNIPKLIGSKKYRQELANNVINCEYKGYQVDFKFAKDAQQYEMVKFYKSYGGFGAVLGHIINHPDVSLQQRGFFVSEFATPAVKIKHLALNKPQHILQFAGLDPKRYIEGFATKNQLCEYLTSTRFFDFEYFVYGYCRDQSKLIKLVRNWCTTTPQEHPIRKKTYNFENFPQYVLAQLKQKQVFEQLLLKKREQLKLHKQVKSKFNSKHIMDIFGVGKKQVDTLRKKFQEHYGEQYDHFLLEHSFEEIVQRFRKVVMDKE